MYRKSCIALQAIICLVVAMTLEGCSTFLKKQSLTEQQRKLNIESLEYVWTTIRDKHYDPDFGGLDWQAVHDELKPRIEKAQSMKDARRIMDDMISRLELTHFNILPAEVYKKMNRPAVKGGEGGITGIDVRVIEGHVLVTGVEESSPANEAGVKTGWEIIWIDEYDVATKIRPIEEEYDGRTLKNLALAYTVKSWLSGKIGDSVAVQFLDGSDQKIKLDIPLVEKSGKRYQFGNVPSFYVCINTKTIDDTIGYITFNVFADPATVMVSFNKAMKSFIDCDGIIIDLRGNPGGMGAMAIGMAGWLVPEKDSCFGTLNYRDNELKIVVNPRARVYSGSVAVLVDGLSTSCSEFFAGGLKDIGRALIFGTRTGGAALPSIVEKLPNGDGFHYAYANYLSGNGTVLEGVGVIPDVEVVHTREALLMGRDLALESAIAWIRTIK